MLFCACVCFFFQLDMFIYMVFVHDTFISYFHTPHIFHLYHHLRTGGILFSILEHWHQPPRGSLKWGEAVGIQSEHEQHDTCESLTFGEHCQSELGQHDMFKPDFQSLTFDESFNQRLD